MYVCEIGLYRLPVAFKDRDRAKEEVTEERQQC